MGGSFQQLTELLTENLYSGLATDMRWQDRSSRTVFMLERKEKVADRRDTLCAVASKAVENAMGTLRGRCAIA